MAEWRNVKGYEGLYLVSNEGDVYSLPKGKAKTGRYLKFGKRGRENKYNFVILSKDGIEKKHSVHRIVAEAFLDNPNNLPEVNHIDEDRFNNRADNLEWCDRQYNMEYSKNKAVLQFDKEGNYIAKHKSVSYASIITGVKRTAINNALKKWSNSAGGYIWKYA